MPEPMTLLEQVNAFKKPNRQRLIIDRTARQRLPVYPSMNHVDNSDVELKTLSFGVYTTKHLVTTGKSMLPYSERNHLDEFLLPSINKDTNRDENRRRRKRKRPVYRKSLFHSYSSISTQADLAQLTARGTKPDFQTVIPIIRDDDTIVNYRCHHAPPPSPSDDEIERLLYELQDRNPSPSVSRQSSVEKEGYIPFRLPVLNRSTQLRRTSTNSPSKDARSTLSSYLQ